MKVKEMNKKDIDDGTNLTRKKLVQARLPFQMISPRPEKLLARKRKLSKDDTCDEDSKQIVKVICAEVKENCDLQKNSSTIKCPIKVRAAILEVGAKPDKGTEGVAVEVDVEKVPDNSEVPLNKETDVMGEIRIWMNKQPEIKVPENREPDVKVSEFKELEGRLTNEPDVKAVDIQLNKEPVKELQNRLEINVCDVKEVEERLKEEPDVRLYKEPDFKKPEFKALEGRLTNTSDVKEIDIQLNKEHVKELQDQLESNVSDVKEVEVRLNAEPDVRLYNEPDVRLYNEPDVKDIEALLSKEPATRLINGTCFKLDEVRLQEPGNIVYQTSQLAAPESCSHSPAASTIAGCKRLQDSGEELEVLPLTPTNVNNSSPLDKRKAGTSPSVASTPAKLLTPKQIQKQKESAKKKEEKERLKQEKEKKRVEEKEKKERQKNEKEDQKKREREEKEKKRLADVELKSEEKRKKDEVREEERRVKEEERRAKEEDRRRKDDAKLVEEKRKEKAAMAFSSFFVTKKVEPRAAAMMMAVTTASRGAVEEVAEPSLMAQPFMPFEVKADMKLAPLVRGQLSAEQRQCLDAWLTDPLPTPPPSSYLSCLRTAGYRPGKAGKTWPQEQDGDDVIIVETDTVCGRGSDERTAESGRGEVSMLRAKLLQFHQNRRPPYRGTWRKNSRIIRPTAPFNMDKALFEYDVDSDDEWEDEGEGESLHGSDDENEKESEDEYEVDNEVFVPHGYLSDEEAENEISDTSPEAQKAKLALLEEEFEAEMRFKTERIRARVIGCIWNDESSMSVSNVGLHVTELFVARRAVWPEALGPIMTRSPTPPCPLSATPLTPGTLPLTKGPKRRDFPDSAMESLIRLVHGNTHSRLFLVKEFTAHYYHQSRMDGVEGGDSTPSSSPPPISKRCVSEKIREIALWTGCTEKGPRNCWLVNESIRESHGLGALTAADNSWVYTLKSRQQQWSSPGPADSAEPAGDSPAASPRSMSHTITKFARVLSWEERRSLLKPVINSKKSGTEGQLSVAVEVPVRKRVPLLMSVGRGVHIASSRQEVPTLAVSSAASIEKNSGAVTRLLQNHNMTIKRITPIPVPRLPAPNIRAHEPPPSETVSKKPLDNTDCIVID